MRRRALDRTRLALASRRLRAAVDAGEVPSAVLAVADSESTLHCEAVSRPGGHPVGVDSVHLLASISKPVMAVAVMQLVEDGLLVLDRPVAEHLPDFDAPDKAAITAWHLLTHSSGIPEVDWPTALRRRPDAAVGYAVARDAELLFRPGDRFSYSTLSFSVLAELVAELSGLAYPDYLRQRVCGPLGMHDTSFDPRAAGRRVVPVKGITAGTDASAEEATEHYLSLAMPGAGLWSTAPDLVRLGQALLAPTAGRPLAPATVDLMTRDHTAHLRPYDETGASPVGYGLGWRKGVLDGRRTLPGSDLVFEHDGAAGGELWIDPAADLVVVFLTSELGADAPVWKRVLAVVTSALTSG